MNFFTLKETSFYLVNTVRLFCVELSKPKVALCCLQAVVAVDRFYNGDVETVALLALSELS